MIEAVPLYILPPRYKIFHFFYIPKKMKKNHSNRLTQLEMCWEYWDCQLALMQEVFFLYPVYWYIYISDAHINIKFLSQNKKCQAICFQCLLSTSSVYYEIY